MLNNQIKVLFFLERDFHITILKPLINYICNANLADIAVYAPFNNNIKSLLNKNFLPNNILILNNPWEWKPDICYMADFSYQYVEGLGKIVNIGHGTISKGWFFTQKNISQRENCADLICVPGEIHKERLEKQVYKPIEITGMPKLDYCFNNPDKKEEILKKLKLDPEQKTILLAPTFNKEFSILPFLRECDLNKVFPDYLNLIIKLHGVSDYDDSGLFEKLRRQRNNVHIADSFDIDEFFIAADLLISDVSSVIYEFASLGKPVILFDSPHIKEYINFDENDLEWEFRDIGLRFSNVDKIPELIFKSLTSSSKGYKRIADKFVSVQDGSSTQKIIEKSFNLLKNQSKKELKIFISDYNQDTVESLKKRYNNTYEIQIVAQEHFFSQIVNQKSDSAFILYLDSNYDCSPLLPSLMLNQAIKNNKHGIIVPLLADNNVHQQQMKLKVKFQQDLDVYQSGIQLTYAFAGINSEIDFALNNCFLINSSYLNPQFFTDLENDKLCWYELLTSIVRDEKQILLAMDCMIYENTQNSEKESFSNDNQNANDSFYSQNKLRIKAVSESGNLTESELKEKFYQSPGDENVILELIKYYYESKDWDQVDLYSDMLPDNLNAMYFGLKSLENQGLLKQLYDKLKKIKFETINDKGLKHSFYILLAKTIIKLSSSDKDSIALYDYPEKYINIVLQEDSTHSDALVTRGILSLTQNNIDEALKDFSTVLFFDKYNKKALKGKALIYSIKGDVLKSVEHYQKVLETDLEDLESIEALLKLSWENKQFHFVEKALENYLEFHPANLDILFTQAGICYEKKEFRKTIELIDKILIFNDLYPGASELKEKSQIHLSSI